ncbi:MAG: gliding motility-associated ABC transporter substrate-binding protein GldG [Cyclobacteriaceae bacterium]
MLAKHSTNTILRFLLVISMVVLINQLFGIFNYRWDLTEEKRFTLHPVTEEIIENLDQPVMIEVYLEGELPSNFQRFRQAIRQTLEQFTFLGGTNIQFKFTDPSSAKSSQSRNQFYRQLIEAGIQPSNVAYTKDGQKTEKLLFPGAIVSYQGQERAVTLLKGNRAMSIEEMLNRSAENIEYELASVISELSQPNPRRVAIVTGHDEPDGTELAGLSNAVLAKYDLFRLDLPNRSTPITGYDAIILTKPRSTFSEKEKFYLDQYIMNGGNLLVFINALSVELSQAEGEGTAAIPYELNLEDLLFKYGVRINRNYVADVNCATTPVYAGEVGDQPRLEMLPWPYFPVVTNYTEHPIVKNLDATLFRFTSSMDSVKAVGISKTPLFHTSANSKVMSSPVKVSYNDLQDKLKPEAFNSGPKVLGYLLEGQFTSLYKNRFPPRGVDKTDVLTDGKTEAKIVVVADGDFIRNDFSMENQNALPMGMDPYTQTSYANEAFVMNTLDYMFDDSELMESRNKQIKIRPLDKARVSEDRDFWQWINIVGPLSLLVLFGIIKSIIRKKGLVS